MTFGGPASECVFITEVEAQSVNCARLSSSEKLLSTGGAWVGCVRVIVGRHSFTFSTCLSMVPSHNAYSKLSFQISPLHVIGARGGVPAPALLFPLNPCSDTWSPHRLLKNTQQLFAGERRCPVLPPQQLPSPSSA